MKKLKLVTLLGGNNFYALPENKEALLNNSQAAKYITEHLVLIDEEGYLKLSIIPVVYVDDFSHIMHFRNEMDARTYMGNQYEYWKPIEGSKSHDFIVTKLKKEYRK